jgi:N6-L-threonylcarbamoyladenine synthase
MKILAIETSCDETAVAVIVEEKGQPIILSSVVSSQIDLHAKTGGIVPEVASRAQMEAITPVVMEALLESSHSVISSDRQRVEKSSANQKISPLFVCDEIGRDDNNGMNYQEAIRLLDDITHIAVTAGPGLIGSLLVGFNAAKTLAYAKDLPLVPINHIEGHIYSALGGISNSKFLISNKIPNTKYQIPNTIGSFQFPVLALTVSGGHTSLTLMKDHGKYKIIGETLDDAVGEAYDKVAKLLGLGYPGGPIISEYAAQFRNKFQISNSKFLNKSQSKGFVGKMQSSIVFPRPIINDGTFNFSLSGLKTAVLIKTKELIALKKLESASKLSLAVKKEIAYAFEEAVADVLSAKTVAAIKKFKPNSVVFAGGVSANQYLRKKLEEAITNIDKKVSLLMPSMELAGDNAAMIGLAAYYHIKNNDVKNWQDISVDSNWGLV